MLSAIVAATLLGWRGFGPVSSLAMSTPPGSRPSPGRRTDPAGLQNFTFRTNPAYLQLRDSFLREHPRDRRKGRVMETQGKNSDRRRRFFKRAAIATLIGGL